MQENINMHVTRGRLNNASFRQKFDPIAKKIFRRQNPLELVFKDISTFDAQNSIVGSLLKELDIGKKDIASTLIKNVTNSVDIEIQSRLNTLKNNENNFDSNFRPPPPPPPSQGSLPSLRPSPPPSNRPRFSSTAPPLSPVQNIFQPVTPSAPPLSPPPPFPFLRTTNTNATRALEQQGLVK